MQPSAAEAATDPFAAEAATDPFAAEAATDPFAAEAATDPFAASRTAFDALTLELIAEPAARLDHAELEDLLELRGRELLRQLFQDHLDLRQVREERAVRVCPAPVIGADGVTRRAIETGHRRQLASIFRTVTVRRCAWRAQGRVNIYPMRPCACPGCGTATGCGVWPPWRRCAARSTRPPRRSVAAAGKWPASGRSSS